MPSSARRLARHLALCGSLLCVAATATGAVTGLARAAGVPQHSADLDEAIVREAHKHGVPEELVRRVVMRESKYNPRARNHSFWGLMQISYPTARSMGFRGTPEQLLNPAVNLAYAVPYLANAFIIAGRRQDAAIRLYASGYYATAKNRGLLGLLRTADSTPLVAAPAEQQQYAAAAEPAAASIEGQQLAYAPEAAAVAPAQAQIAAAVPVGRAMSSATASTDKNGADGDIAMVVDRNGAAAPPKKWLRDGGSTVMARGEQPVERIAAVRLGDAGDAPARRRGRAHKTTTFAALEPAPQAAPGQTAEAQPQPIDPAQASAYTPVPQAVAAAGAVADPAPDAASEPKKHAVKRSSHRTRVVKQAAGTKVAKAAAPEPQQASAQ